MSKNEKAGPHAQSQETRATAAPSTDDLRTACEIHTLAQMVYSQFHTASPWMNVVPPPAGYTHQAATPTMPDPRMGPVWCWPQAWRY